MVQKNLTNVFEDVGIVHSNSVLYSASFRFSKESPGSGCRLYYCETYWEYTGSCDHSVTAHSGLLQNIAPSRGPIYSPSDRGHAYI